MRETSITCDKCGASALMISSVEVYQDVGEISDAEAGQFVPDSSCRVDCPKCGVRIQTVQSHKRGRDGA